MVSLSLTPSLIPVSMRTTTAADGRVLSNCAPLYANNWLRDYLWALLNLVEIADPRKSGMTSHSVHALGQPPAMPVLPSQLVVLVS